MPPLTREQTLAAAWLVALAYADAGPAGATIAQGAKGAGHGHGGPKHVATAKGAAHFHAGIGGMIIPHGYHPHWVAGAPGHEVKGDISEAKWIANQWGKGAKGHQAAKDAAEAAVAAGTHHWVQAGEHAYAVHNDLETHVPKDADLHDPAAVKNAPKVIVKPGSDGEHVQLHPENGPGPEIPHHPADSQELAQNWKKLPPQEPKKAVTFGGKHAVWVPHDWQVHSSGSALQKYAKAPDGTWHVITKSGTVHQVNAADAESMLSMGQLAPDDEHPGPDAGHVVPNQGAAGHEPAKADVGGVAVTKDEIHAAIAHLNDDKSTAVKQPLAKQGHPLAAMDYHGVAKAELAAHPELKVSAGSKKAHVGQVKLAVLHHLAGKANQLAQDEAHAKAAEQVTAKTEAAAVHAQQLTPGSVDIGGVTVSHEHIADAIAHLNASGSTAIKQILKAKGNPLATSDYWSVINAHKAAHPELQTGTGTKAKHVAGAKTLFTAALQEHLDVLSAGGAAEQHSAAADLDSAVSAGTVKPGWELSSEGAVAMAMVQAHKSGNPVYVSLSAQPGMWKVTSVPPAGMYYAVTPEHKVTQHLDDGTDHAWTDAKAAGVAKEWGTSSQPSDEPEPAAEPPQAPEPKTPEPEPAKPEPPKAPEPEPAPAPVWDTEAWKQTPEYQAVHALIADHPLGLPPHGNKLDTNQQLAAALYLAGKTGTKYLYPGIPVGWNIAGHLPSGVAGTFGAPGKSYYEISHDHEITAYGADGQPVALAPETIKEIAEQWLTPAPEPEPAKPGEPEPAPVSEPAEPEQHSPEPEPEPTSAAPVSSLDDAKKLLVNGAVKPLTMISGGKLNPDFVMVTVLQKAAKTGSEQWATPGYNGGWIMHGYEPYEAKNGSEYYHVTADLQVTHHAADGASIVFPAAQVAAAAQQLMVPDSAKVKVGDEWKIVPHGFYYKPSKTAKAYLEIKPWQQGSIASGATFIYHAPSGDKEVNGTYAGKVLADATDYHAQPKHAGPTAAKVTYAAVFAPGSYMQWSDIQHAPSAEHSFEFHEDGSLLLHGPGGSMPLSAGGQPEIGLLKGGVVLDQYGTSAVKPGLVPYSYHIFGSEAKTPEQVKDLLSQLEAAYSDSDAIASLVHAEFPGPAKAHAYEFFSAKVPAANWEGQRDALMGLLRNLLEIPHLQPGDVMPSGSEVKFLKGLPPGIATAKDVFSWTAEGYAKPAETAIPDLKDLPVKSSTALTAVIKAVSEEFGGGKVVGTHPSGLTKDLKAAWIQAWTAGDMAKVFALDALGGKVSPAHPGAPGNESTHNVSWAPWDPSQVPASQQLEGTWSPEGTLPTKAEVDNYLIKAGLQHAAWLTAKQRREWMQAHRGHDQLTVDKLSKIAAGGFNSGAQPKTEPPKFTQNLGPADPWDAYLDEKTPAQNWSKDVLDSFIAGHKAELGPFAQPIAEQYGLNSKDPEATLSGDSYYSIYVKKGAVQGYLEDLAAKEAAEKLKPKFHLADAKTAEDQFGRQYEWVIGTQADLARRAAVAMLAKAWGFRTPQVSPAALEDGTAGAIIPQLDHDGTLAGISPQSVSGLTSRQLGDIAREHVLDFALANPGSTPGSYLKLPDGSVAGTGKAAALSDLGWAGTDPVQMNAYATQPVSAVLSAIGQGLLGQDQADAAYLAAARAAQRMAALPDSRVQGALAGAGLQPDQVQALLERKNGLPGQVAAMWDKAYADAGLTQPEVPAAKISRGLHSGFSEPDFMDHVAAGKSFGVPAFFAEAGIASGHVLVWTELDPKNQRLVRGEASIRGHVLDKVTGWVKAHSGDASSMVPKDEADIALAIKTAAEAINTHAKDQIWSGPITAKALSEMAAAKTKLYAMMTAAQQAVNAGPASAAYQQAAKDYGDPPSVISMAQHYLAQIDTAEHAKVSGLGGLTPDQFPGWKPTEQAHEIGGGVKITYKKSRRELGTNASEVSADTWSLGKDDGELHLAAGKHADYPGYVWQVTLPTGEVIEINDSAETQTPKAHTGMIRFNAVTGDGSASLERIRAFLQSAGLPMDEATQTDMENLYWRTLAWVLSDRADRKDPKYLKVWDEIAGKLYGKKAGEVTGPGKQVKFVGELPAKAVAAGLPPEEEAAMWRQAWAHLTSPEQVQQWVDDEGYLPHLNHFDLHNPEATAGKPDWYRFDVTAQQVAANQFLTQGFYDGAKDAVLVARSGGLYSSDSRLRALGTYKTGMSWGADMGYGSSGTVFTRQNMEASTGMNVWISPRVLARAQTYTFGSDLFGKTEERRTSSYFNFTKASAHAGSGNEAMILDAISLLDDIEVLKAASESQRQSIIADLKAKGLTEIRGLSLEDRIVTQAGVPAAIAKAKAAMQADGWFAQPENPFIPEPSALSSGPVAEKKFASSVVEKNKAADVQQQDAGVTGQLDQLAKEAGEVPFSYAA